TTSDACPRFWPDVRFQKTETNVSSMIWFDYFFILQEYGSICKILLSTHSQQQKLNIPRLNLYRQKVSSEAMGRRTKSDLRERLTTWTRTRAPSFVISALNWA